LPRRKEKGINPAFPLLIILVIIFIAAVSYLATPPQTNTPSRHTYFEEEAFALASGKTWHVGVPVTQDGNLHLSIISNSTIQLYVKNGNSYLLNSQVYGDQSFTLPVSSMSILEVGVTNNGLQPVAVEQFTCVWTI